MEVLAPMKTRSFASLRMTALLFLLASGFWLLTPAVHAQVTVNILDTLKNADGTNASGRLLITWNPFTTAAGITIDGGTINYTIIAGVINLNLTPNIGAAPAGTSYRARYTLANGATYTETWVVPASGPVTIAAIRSLTPPTPNIMVASTQITGINAILPARSITFVIGCESCQDLADTDDQAGFWRNNISALTIAEVWCQTDAGTSIINLQRDDGTPANILSSNLTCTSTGATGAIALAEDNLALGNIVDFVMETAAASGTPKRLTVSIRATLDLN